MFGLLKSKEKAGNKKSDTFGGIPVKRTGVKAVDITTGTDDNKINKGGTFGGIPIKRGGVK